MISAKPRKTKSVAVPKAVKPRAGLPVAADPAMQRWLNKWFGILTEEGKPRLKAMVEKNAAKKPMLTSPKPRKAVVKKVKSDSVILELPERTARTLKQIARLLGVTREVAAEQALEKYLEQLKLIAKNPKSYLNGLSVVEVSDLETEEVLRRIKRRNKALETKQKKINQNNNK